MTNTLICQVDDLELRVLELKDAPRVEGLKEGYTAYMGEWLYMGTAEDFITSALEQFEKNQGFQAGVWQAGQLVGVVGLRQEQRRGGIDYMLASAFRGKGIMTKVVKALVDYGFNELNLNRMDIHADTKNVKSCAIPERLGFTKEGVCREWICYGDSFGDMAIYAVLASEWQK